MPIFSFASSGTPGMSTRTYAQTLRMVARPVGGADRPAEVGAGDAVEQAIDDLNAYRWEYLTVRGSDITLYAASGRTAGQEGYLGQYSMPTAFKDPSSLIITGSDERKLTYVTRADWDAMVQGTVGGTWFYTNFGYGQSNYLTLLDAPSASGTMELRYYRPIDKPGSDQEFMDIPEGPLQSALVSRAQFYCALWNRAPGPVTRDLWSVSEQSIARAKRDDRVRQDGEYQFIPAVLTAAGSTNLNAVPRLGED